ncbi:MAG TPA: aldo/keto reductase [Hyphomicrobiaceae bacterium]|jgi:aryl-alcohol dehydrogenase-like predicted oxidoreductase|nr:aldo/keto reductase [Hyphomicrobiaceae bacterium]
MKERNLGPSGLRVSVVGLGCNNFGAKLDLEGSRKVIHKALDAGITLLDTADMYGGRGGSETIIGEVLGARRKDIVLATKFGWEMDDEGRKRGASRRYIMSAVEDSLKRLKTDWIDLYQYHKPDPLTPLEETMATLDDLVRQGKVRYVGCSNMPAWQVAKSQEIARAHNMTAFISCQDEYSLVVRNVVEPQLAAAMEHYGLGLLPFFPLASGLLSGKYARSNMPADGRLSQAKRWADKYLNDANWTKVEKLEAFAKARGHTLLELAFSWLACKSPVTSVIAGATTPAQVEANVKAADWQLTAEDMAEVDSITMG